MGAASCGPQDVAAYVGPHIGAADYQVSQQLANEFVAEFGDDVVQQGRNLDLGAAVRRALYEQGLPKSAIVEVAESTTRTTQRFYSYRAEGGACGRHGALACILSSDAS